LLLCAVLMTLRLGQMAVQQGYEAPGPLAVSRNVVIPPGGTAGAAAVLQKAGAVSYALVFRAAVWLTRQRGPLRAGEYFIPARSSVHEILDILRFGAPVEHQVTIPEGLTGVQIARVLNAAPEAAGKVAPPPDGAVLPQTYDYTYHTSRQAILKRAEVAMNVALEDAWAGREKTIGLTSPYQAVVLASIVQQETPVPGELPEIAAVYENRLALGMRLQADPTVIYAASNGASSGGLPISRTDLGNPSPYNTYLYPGLPPGPICAPGIAAIEAVLHPAASGALFFVATGSGGHVFAENFKQQLSNIKKYRAAMGD
jgi:UPF0755 protein